MKSINVDFKPQIHKLELLSLRNVEGEYSGEFRSLQRRKGIEFEDYRQFAPGDDASTIDWKSSLRSGTILLREYTQLKTLSIFFLVDVSNSMLFSSHDKLKCEYAAELAASLSYFFIKSDDMVSLAMFNDRVVKFVPPNFGNRHFSVISRLLSDPSLYGGNLSLTNTLNNIQGSVREGAIVVLISDFLGLEKDWDRTLKAISTKADIVAFIVRDPQDMELSARVGHAIISDPYSEDILFVDTQKISESYQEEVKKQLDEVQRALHRAKADSLLLSTDKSFVEPLVRFFAARKAKWQQ